MRSDAVDRDRLTQRYNVRCLDSWGDSSLGPRCPKVGGPWELSFEQLKSLGSQVGERKWQTRQNCRSREAVTRLIWGSIRSAVEVVEDAGEVNQSQHLEEHWKPGKTQDYSSSEPGGDLPLCDDSKFPKSEDERALRSGLECLRSPLRSSKGNVMPVYAGCSQFSYWKQKVSTDTNSLHRQVLLFRFRLSELPVPRKLFQAYFIASFSPALKRQACLAF
ncbi:hypothetical protein E5288_WYG000861 [Bos mutus]|uniref:Uncharacterized protein n=1 Tax=Bos mutus TaxID=72004 RepID=A0A6B0RK52_9CETA|nr:hypothetical protein [Bos mutus]